MIAYLQAAAEGKEAQKRGGMQARKPDLHKVPPSALVKSIRYCGNTCTLETADGKSQKAWEFNLRFKSDSSKLGPAPGAPVAVGDQRLHQGVVSLIAVPQ